MHASPVLGPRRHRAAALACALLGATLAASCSHRDRDRRDPEAATPVATATAEPTAIDAAIAAHWRSHGVTPVANADDLTLLRRASLDLLGRVPTVAELDAFETEAAPDRYERAVDRMLASEDHARHLAATWSEVLVGGALQLRPRVLLGMRTWLEGRFGADVGFDRITTEMLTVSGEIEDDSAAGYMVTHGRRGRTTVVAGATARVFLAAQIQCAQCHDHPSAPLRQEDFYGFAAHFAATGVRPSKGEGYGRIVDRPRGQQRLPRPEDPPDEPGGAIVAPSYFGVPTPLGDGTRREALAAAITSDRRFALALANRTWAQLFGRGIVEPVDDIPLGGEVPPLLDALADEVVAHGFAIDPLLRTLATSRAYRLDARGPDVDGARVDAFAQAAVRPVPLESLLRSLATAGADHDVSLRRVLERRRGELRDLRFAFADDEGAAADDGPSLQQAMLWLRGDLTEMVASDAPGRALRTILRDESSASARIEALWRRFYGRRPDDTERRLALAHVASDDPAAYEDLVHALVTSSEFTSNH